VILIDIPIGLSDTGWRECDGPARRLLGRGRSASVFTPPCRAALVAADYREALRLNRTVTGKGIFIQAWNICSKIREVDDFLTDMLGAGGVLRESHPELCFYALNGGAAMRHNKKTPAGQTERRAVLERHLPGLERHWPRLLEALPAGLASVDDLMDALILAVSAALGPETLRRLPARPQRDRRGRPMEILFPPVVSIPFVEHGKGK
jgi:predicted RNase H-like nuclease